MKLAYRNFLYEAIDLENIVVDGINRQNKNSLGEYIAASKEAIENFWKWFGNSQTVDDQGRPVVFYHGSYLEFDEFEHPWDREENEDYSEGYNGGNLGVGFYFTENHEYASRFGKPGKYYLRITNLYDLSNETNISELNSRFEEEKDDLAYGAIGEVIDDVMNEKHYDGAYAQGAGGLSYGADEWKVIKGSQVKSVNNSGSFSSGNKFAKE